MNQPEPPTYIVAQQERVSTPDGPMLSYKFLSNTFPNHDPHTGDRIWMPTIDMSVAEWPNDLRAAHAVGQIYGGYAIDREQMERLLESDMCVNRLESSVLLPDVDVMRLTTPPVNDRQDFGIRGIGIA